MDFFCGSTHVYTKRGNDLTLLEIRVREIEQSHPGVSPGPRYFSLPPTPPEGPPPPYKPFGEVLICKDEKDLAEKIARAQRSIASPKIKSVYAVVMKGPGQFKVQFSKKSFPITFDSSKNTYSVAVEGKQLQGGTLMELQEEIEKKLECVRYIPGFEKEIAKVEKVDPEAAVFEAAKPDDTAAIIKYFFGKKVSIIKEP